MNQHLPWLEEELTAEERLRTFELAAKETKVFQLP